MSDKDMVMIRARAGMVNDLVYWARAGKNKPTTKANDRIKLRFFKKNSIFDLPYFLFKNRYLV